MQISIEQGLMAISSAMNRVQNLYREIEQEASFPYGLSTVLYVLFFNDATTQKQISEACAIPKQTVNNVIRELKAQGYVTLAEDDADKRQKQVSLTATGRAYAEQTLAPLFQLNEKVGARVGAELLEKLADGLSALGNAIECEIELHKVALKWEEKSGGEKE